ncbi:hypothetical protein HYH03_000739 [Edaphochlamys debaryana]|uniref:Uncharacterized protein n=1 Tax=Edaphochlamys debaryana TaxID=47281 RepID=A0A835YJA5_9CHLO|nr:hypothetical protein HYH03_000739 [Edaphochlamys debaryana]|eukprot:KAG2502253.1 hypothetical protein HYH03_000739 [Edaphochlamys debaryana]
MQRQPLVARRASRQVAVPVRAASTVLELSTGAWVVAPPVRSKGVVHFLGGAFAGAAPQVVYSLLLDTLAAAGYTSVAIPYAVTFRHDDNAHAMRQRFLDSVAELRASGLGEAAPPEAPCFGLGHSNGALLHMLIGSFYPGATASNIVMSFNNKQVKDAIPIPGLMEAVPGALQAARAAMGSLDALPLPLPRPDQLPTGGDVLRTMASFLPRDLGLDAAGQLSRAGLLLDQIPSVFNEVGNGATDFYPTPAESRAIISRSYSVSPTLLVRFSDDSIDESPEIAALIKPRLGSGCTLLTLPGSHITPCGGDLPLPAGVPSVFGPAEAFAQVVKEQQQADIQRLARQLRVKGKWNWAEAGEAAAKAGHEAVVAWILACCPALKRDLVAWEAAKGAARGGHVGLMEQMVAQAQAARAAAKEARLAARERAEARAAAWVEPRAGVQQQEDEEVEPSSDASSVPDEEDSAGEAGGEWEVETEDMEEALQAWQARASMPYDHGHHGRRLFLAALAGCDVETVVRLVCSNMGGAFFMNMWPEPEVGAALAAAVLGTHPGWAANAELVLKANPLPDGTGCRRDAWLLGQVADIVPRLQRLQAHDLLDLSHPLVVLEAVVCGGDLAGLKWLLAAGAGVSVEEEEKWALSQHAARKGHVDVLRAIKQAHWQLKPGDLLETAASEGHVPVMAWLWETFPGLALADLVFCAACSSGSMEAVLWVRQRLQVAGPQVQGLPPGAWADAAVAGCEAVVELLAELGAPMPTPGSGASTDPSGPQCSKRGRTAAAAPDRTAPALDPKLDRQSDASTRAAEDAADDAAGPSTSAPRQRLFSPQGAAALQSPAAAPSADAALGPLSELQLDRLMGAVLSPRRPASASTAAPLPAGYADAVRDYVANAESAPLSRR